MAYSRPLNPYLPSNFKLINQTFSLANKGNHKNNQRQTTNSNNHDNVKISKKSNKNATHWSDNNDKRKIVYSSK